MFCSKFTGVHPCRRLLLITKRCDCKFSWNCQYEHCSYWQLFILAIVQRQPCRGVLKKRCSENIQQIYSRTPMPKCDFNKVANLLIVFSQHSGSSLKWILKWIFIWDKILRQFFWIIFISVLLCSWSWFCKLLMLRA